LSVSLSSLLIADLSHLFAAAYGRVSVETGDIFSYGLIKPFGHGCILMSGVEKAPRAGVGFAPEPARTWFAPWVLSNRTAVSGHRYHSQKQDGDRV